MNLLEKYADDKLWNDEELLCRLQIDGKVSDLCVTLAEVHESDCIKAIQHLEGK